MRKKQPEYHSYYENNQRHMSCMICGSYERVDEKTTSVKCSKCVQTLTGPLEKTVSYKPTGRPAGWHWMKEFVDKDGNVFHKGKEVPKLKGTLPSTKITPRKKTKRRTKQQMLIARHKEKKAELKKVAHKQKKNKVI